MNILKIVAETTALSTSLSHKGFEMEKCSWGCFRQEKCEVLMTSRLCRMQYILSWCVYVSHPCCLACVRHFGVECAAHQSVSPTSLELPSGAAELCK